MTTDVVVSAYSADLFWLSELPPVDRLIVYDKADDECKRWSDRAPFFPRSDAVKPLPGRYRVALPNVGKCDHSFLHHIVTQWDDLADWTVFTVDHPFDHMDGKPFAKMLEPRDSVSVPWLCRVTDWGTDGRLQWHTWTNRPDRNGTTWAERYASGRIAKAELSFADFAKECGCYLHRWPGYHPGGVFAAPRSAIRERRKGLYWKLLDLLSHHREPEEGHYLERLWVQLLGGDFGPAGTLPANADIQVPLVDAFVCMRSAAERINITGATARIVVVDTRAEAETKALELAGEGLKVAVVVSEEEEVKDGRRGTVE